MKTNTKQPPATAPAVRVMYAYSHEDCDVLSDLAPAPSDRFGQAICRQVLVIDLSRKEEVVEVMYEAISNADANDGCSYREMAQSVLTALQQHAQRKKVRST